jgi:hypothetical protein
MAAAAMTPRASETAFRPASFPGVSFIESFLPVFSCALDVSCALVSTLVAGSDCTELDGDVACGGL